MYICIYVCVCVYHLAILLIPHSVDRWRDPSMVVVVRRRRDGTDQLCNQPAAREERQNDLVNYSFFLDKMILINV